MIVWLDVPFREKDEARRAGAKWSAGHKRWYVENAEDLKPFLRWIDERLKKPVGTKEKPRQRWQALRG